HHRAAQRPARRRRQAGRGDRLADRAGGLSRRGLGAKRRMSDLLVLSGVHTHIGRYHILQGVDLIVPEGPTTMLLGRNGAGKTSTLRTIMGLWQASAGEISLAGQRIERVATPDIARLGVGYVPETMAGVSDLTVRENLVLAARDGPIDDARLQWIFGFFPALKRFWLSRAGSLSGGQKQMVSIARAIIQPRRLLLSDQPATLTEFPRRRPEAHRRGGDRKRPHVSALEPRPRAPGRHENSARPAG